MWQPTTLLLLALCCSFTHALRIGTAATQFDRATAHMRSAIAEQSKGALVSMLCAVCIATTAAPQSAMAAAPTIEEAIIEVTSASYPILKALQAETFVPFSEKIGSLVLDIPAAKLGKSIALGIDVLDSVPDAELTKFNGIVKDAFAELKTDSCTLVPLPSSKNVAKFNAIVASDSDAAAKIKEFDAKWGPTLSALSKTDSAICLPPAATLTKLSLAQADVGRAFGAAEAKAFAAYSTPVLKSSITVGKVLPLLGDAKKLAPTASAAEKAAFQAAGKRIEAASKQEAFNKVNAQRAAAQAEKAKPVDPEVAKAQREAAVKEAKAKADAKIAAKEAEKQAFKEAEAKRVAELKAKSAAIAAAKAAK